MNQPKHNPNIRIIPGFQENPDVAKLARALLAVAEKKAKEEQARKEDAMS